MLFGLNEAAVATPAVATNLFNESYDFVAMEQEMIVESARAWNKIQYMVGEANCRLIHESITNPEGLENLMEGVVGGFFKKVKEFFIKLKNMIVEVFQKFMMWLNSKIRDEKVFAEKYEKELLDKIQALKEIEVKGYKYTHITDEIPSLPASSTITINGDTAEAKKEDIDKTVAKFRGSCVGDNTKEVAGEDFTEELVKYYRDGEDSPVDITIKSEDVKTILNDLKSFSKDKSAVEKAKNKIEKELNDIVKELNNTEKDLEKQDGKEKELKDVQLKIEALKDMSTNRNQAFAAKIAAIKDRANFGKKVLLAVKSAKKENNSTIGGLFSMNI